MNFDVAILPLEVAIPFGWALIHSLWQGALIAAVLWGLFRFTRERDPRIRYWLCGLALLGLLTTTCGTFFNLYQSGGATLQVLSASQVAGSTTQPTSGNGFMVGTLSGMGDLLNRHILWIVTLWILGFLFTSLKLAGGLIYSQRLRSSARGPIPPAWQELLETLCNQVGVSRAVVLAESALVKVPLLVGHFKPLILLPLGTLTGLSRREMEAILLHELGHVIRNDFLVNLIQSVVEVLFFYHPAVWWISSQMRTEREHCCDDLASAVTSDPKTLARALANLQEVQMQSPQLNMAFGGSSNHLLTRIQRLVKGPETGSNFISRLLAFAAVGIGFTWLSLSAWAGTPGMTQSKTHLQDPVEQSELEKEKVLVREKAREKELLELQLREIEMARHLEKQRQIEAVQSSLSHEPKEVILQQMRDLETRLIALREILQHERLDGHTYRGEKFSQEALDLKARVREEKLNYERLKAAQQLKALARQQKELEAAMAKKVKEDQLKQYQRVLEKKMELERVHQQIQTQKRELSREKTALEELEKKRKVEATLVRQQLIELKKREDAVANGLSGLKKEVNGELNLIRAIKSSLMEDGLIKAGTSGRFELTKKSLRIYGEKQPNAMARKYRRLYQEIMEKELSKGATLTIELK